MPLKTIKEVSYGTKSFIEVAQGHTHRSGRMRPHSIFSYPAGSGQVDDRQLSGVFRMVLALAHFPLGDRDPLLYSSCLRMEDSGQYREGQVFLHGKREAPQVDILACSRRRRIFLCGQRGIPVPEYEPSLLVNTIFTLSFLDLLSIIA